MCAAKTIRARHYQTTRPLEVKLKGSRIESVTLLPDSVEQRDWPTIAPGMVDLQINGYGGIWYSSESLTCDEVLKTLDQLRRRGITQLCPTLITNSSEALENGLRAISKACEQELWADQTVLGCHVEGPFISAIDGPRGAHPLQHVRPASLVELSKWQSASGNRVRLVTLAPEAEGAIPFIRGAVSQGVRIAIGHCAATAEQIHAAADAGATLSTHLGNGCLANMHRHHNVIWPQLAENRLWSSVISDGHHLPDTLLTSIVRAKSLNRVILTCDAAGWAGCPPGVYHLGILDSEILPSGKLVVAGQTEVLAGSSSTTSQCIAMMSRQTGLGLGEVYDLSARNTPLFFGEVPGTISPEALANLLVFHWQPGDADLSLVEVIAQGETLEPLNTLG